MSKLTKSDLKVIVKECLIEILAEGLAEKQIDHSRSRSKKESLREAILRRKNLESDHTPLQTEIPSQSRRKSYLDNISFQQAEPSVQEQNIQIKERVSRVTSDPILSEMLADTAMTTLPTQMSADSARKMSSQQNPPADAAARVVQTTPLEDLFGNESSSKWATLAFGG